MGSVFYYVLQVGVIPRVRVGVFEFLRGAKLIIKCAIVMVSEVI